MSRSVKARPTVFAWATGQLDNIGDSLLRRPYLALLRTLGPLQVWTGNAPESFRSGLGIEADEDSRSTFRRWYARAFLATLTRRVVIALNSGEVPVSRRGALKLGQLAVLGFVASARGGGVIWMGAGIPVSRHRLLAVPYRLATRTAGDPTFRTAASIAMAGGGRIQPDWAFALGTASADWCSWRERHQLALVLRGDRPLPAAGWFDWVRAVAQELTLDPVVVVQVERDLPRAEEVAALLGARVESAIGESHHEQEARVRRIYADSMITVGDRLHGLIVAGTEGSVPLGWVPTSGGKIGSHFAVIGLEYVAQHEGEESLPDLSCADVQDAHEQLATAIETARAELKNAPRPAIDRMRLRLGASHG